jgi:DNA polymerase
MKAVEKERVYSFLAKAASLAFGAAPAAFDSVPQFDDDAEPVAPNAIQSSDADGVALIAEQIAACSACALCQTRTHTVPGTGAAKPAVMVIGEAPGKDEDEQGLPFVGKAGQLLDKMLAAIGLFRNQNCFIANTIKCRPPGNRDPFPSEQDACFHFLQSQINALKPKAILVVGRIALQKLLGTAMGITRIHGQFFDYENIPLMATFHPSFLLRDPAQKRPAWEDLKKFEARLMQLCPDYKSAEKNA